MFTTSRTTRRRLAIAGALVLATAGPLAACGDDDDSGSASDTEETSESSAVTVSDQWARPGTAGGNGAVYLDLTGGDEDDALVGADVSSDVATDAQVHETTTDSDDTDSDDTDSDDTDSDDTDSGEMESGDTDSDEMESGEMESGEMEESDGSSGSGMMSMQEVESIPVPAGETASLEPGGFHIMLTDLQADLAVGDSVEVTLTFESGDEQKVTAEVKEP